MTGSRPGGLADLDTLVERYALDGTGPHLLGRRSLRTLGPRLRAS